MEIQELIGKEISGETHLLLEHSRTRNFRWIVFLELFLFLLFFLILLPVLIILAVVIIIMGGSLSLDDVFDSDEGLSKRFFTYKHKLKLKALGKDLEVLVEAEALPDSKEAAENLIFDLMESLHKKQLVLVEVLGGDLKEHMTNWYGGKPLMALQKDFCERDSEEVFKHKGLEIEESKEGKILRYKEEGRKRSLSIALAVILIPLIIIYPLVCITLFIKPVRQFLYNLFLDVIGKPQAVWEFSVKADCLSLTRSRSKTENFLNIHGRELLGISFAAGLGYDREVTYHSKFGQIITKSGIEELPSWISKFGGEDLCNWLLAVSLRLRSEKPELGLNFDQERPSKCPYCASIYVFKPGQNCPSCGGWPDKIQ